MKTALFLLCMVSALFSEGTYDGYFFTDHEELISLWFVNHASYQQLLDINIDSSSALSIIDNRYPQYTDLTQVSSLLFITGADMDYIRHGAYILTLGNEAEVLNELGLTEAQTNFLYGLSGVLVGFTFLFGFVQVITKSKRFS